MKIKNEKLKIKNGGGGGQVLPSRASICRSTSQRSAGRSLDCGRSEKSHAVRQPAAAPWRRAATRALVASPSARLRAGVAFTRKHVPFDVADVGGPQLRPAKARNSRPLAACASQAAAPRKGRACRSMSQPRLCEGPQLASARCVCFASCGSEKGSYLLFDVAASPLRRPATRVCSLRVLRKLRLRVRIVACWSTLQRAAGHRRLRFAKDACAATKRAVPYAKEPPVCMDGVNTYLKKIDEISL